MKKERSFKSTIFKDGTDGVVIEDEKSNDVDTIDDAIRRITLRYPHYFETTTTSATKEDKSSNFSIDNNPAYDGGISTTLLIPAVAKRTTTGETATTTTTTTGVPIDRTNYSGEAVSLEKGIIDDSNNDVTNNIITNLRNQQQLADNIYVKKNDIDIRESRENEETAGCLLHHQRSSRKQKIIYLRKRIDTLKLLTKYQGKEIEDLYHKESKNPLKYHQLSYENCKLDYRFNHQFEVYSKTKVEYDDALDNENAIRLKYSTRIYAQDHQLQNITSGIVHMTDVIKGLERDIKKLDKKRRKQEKRRQRQERHRELLLLKQKEEEEKENNKEREEKRKKKQQNRGGGIFGIFNNNKKKNDQNNINEDDDENDSSNITDEKDENEEKKKNDDDLSSSSSSLSSASSVDTITSQGPPKTIFIDLDQNNKLECQSLFL